MRRWRGIGDSASTQPCWRQGAGAALSPRPGPRARDRSHHLGDM